MEKMKRIAAMTAALLICSGVMGYMPAETLKGGGFAANAAGDTVAESVEINETNFPDEIFRQYVAENFDTDGDGVLYAAELEVSIIKVDYKNISDLTGIEHFKNLKMLTCINNNITNLDLSKNTKLKELVCYKNQIETINIANCTELEALWCYNNKISSIDISNASNLKNLWCSENELTTLDASNNTALESLRCDNNKITRLEISDNATLTTLNCENNQLTTFNISNNTALTKLSCHNNQLENLDVSNNTALTNLSCNNNLLTTLDISTNVALEELYCGSNRLASLDVSNNTELGTLACYENSLTSLDLSNNTALTNLSCYGNQLKTLDLSNNAALKYLYCGSNELTTLDVSTNTALEELYFFNNKLKAVDVSKNTALKELNCQENQITTLDITTNTALEYLHCGSNYLTSLDVSNNTVLKEVRCDQNQLATLDLSKNTALTELHCGSNQFTVLDISNNTALTELHCDRNHLTSLDISNTSDSIFIFSINNKYEINLTNGKFDLSTLPTGFDITKASDWTNATVKGNILTVEDITKEVTYKYDCGKKQTVTFTLIPSLASETPNVNVAIDETKFPDANFRKYVADKFDKDGDGVLSAEEIETVTEMTLFDHISHSKIEVSDLKGIEYFTSLELLDCHTQNLKELDLSRNTSLKALDCRENQLTTLDLSNNTALTSLKCDNNQLAELDLSNNTELLMLYCNENQLTTLNVSKNTMLNRLECIKNKLTTIDTSNNTNLQTLMCDENQLTTLDISNNTLLDYLSCNQNQLKTIDISKNEELDFLKCNNNQITSIDTHGRSLSLEIFDNAYEIALTDNTFDLSTLPEGFDVTKASNWTNAEVEGNILTVIDDTKYVTYDYDCEKGITLSFALFTKNNTDNQVPEKLDVVINQENFPDKAFRQYITERVDDDQNGRLSYSEAMGESTMHISESGISDLTGLQYFKNLYVLDCSDNDLTQLDISENKALTHLNCENNNLTALDTSNNPFLYVLFCKQNNLTNLDVTNNTKLAALWCSGNQLTTLDVSKNTALKDLGCDNNQLTSLDLSNNNVLTGDEIVFDTSDNKYEISVIGNTFDLSTLPTGFDVSKTSEWTNGTVDGNILTVGNASEWVTYKYDCGNGHSETFTLIPQIEETPVETTTATTTPEKPPVSAPAVSLGDINGNGSIDSSDATLVLSDYAVIATGGKSTFTAEQAKAADINNDGKCDSIDASLILAYYAHTSTGGTGTIEEYISKANADEQLKALREKKESEVQLFAAAYIGCTDDMNEVDAVEWIKENSPVFCENYSFVENIPAGQIAGTHMGELYCIVPFDENSTVVINRAVYDENGNGSYENVIYRSESGEPVLLFCNNSGVDGDTMVTITDSDGNKDVWFPGLDEKLMMNCPYNANYDTFIYDFSHYQEILEKEHTVRKNSGWKLPTAADLQFTNWSGVDYRGSEVIGSYKIEFGEDTAYIKWVDGDEEHEFKDVEWQLEVEKDTAVVTFDFKEFAGILQYNFLLNETGGMLYTAVNFTNEDTLDENLKLYRLLDRYETIS